MAGRNDRDGQSGFDEAGAAMPASAAGQQESRSAGQWPAGLRPGASALAGLGAAAVTQDRVQSLPDVIEVSQQQRFGFAELTLAGEAQQLGVLDQGLLQCVLRAELDAGVAFGGLQQRGDDLPGSGQVGLHIKCHVEVGVEHAELVATALKDPP